MQHQGAGAERLTLSLVTISRSHHGRRSRTALAVVWPRLRPSGDCQGLRSRGGQGPRPEARAPRCSFHAGRSTEPPLPPADDAAGASLSEILVPECVAANKANSIVPATVKHDGHLLGQGCSVTWATPASLGVRSTAPLPRRASSPAPVVALTMPAAG